MAGDGVTWTMKNAEAKTGRLLSSFASRAKVAMARWGMEVEAFIVRSRFGDGPRGGPLLHVRSGMLRGSIASVTEGTTLEDLCVKVGSTCKYAGTHEKGRLVHTSTNGKTFIPLPCDAALTGAGVLRAPITDDSAWAGAFWYRTKNGKLFRAREDDSGRLEMLFYMVRFEDMPPIPKRLGLRDAIVQYLPKLKEMLQEAMRESAREAGLNAHA
jgi:hypothetical protein